eukprot:3851338-Rhodomonas_salina.3
MVCVSVCASDDHPALPLRQRHLMAHPLLLQHRPRHRGLEGQEGHGLPVHPGAYIQTGYIYRYTDWAHMQTGHICRQDSYRLDTYTDWTQMQAGHICRLQRAWAGSRGGRFCGCTTSSRISQRRSSTTSLLCGTSSIAVQAVWLLFCTDPSVCWYQYVLYPLCFGFSVFSLMYNHHKRSCPLSA